MSQSKNIFNTTDSTFQTDVASSPNLTLVDFWAEWCGPCRLLSPTLEKLADEYEGKIKVYKMNVDENTTVPAQFSIRGIPSVLFFKNGQVVDQLVGNQPKDAFANVIQKHL